MKKEALIVILLLLASFPAVRALFLPGGFTSHDLTHHVIRQISMDKLLSEGQFPPRWSRELNNGYGYPVFLFNYPLPALLGEGFHKLGFGFVDSVKAVLFLSMVLSVVGMYLFLRSYLGSGLASFLGSVFYLYAPHRFLNVYVAAAVGGALGDGILPFVFWSMMEIRKGKGWAPLVGAVSLAGLILSHNLTALIFAPVIAVFALMLVREVREVRVVRDLGVMFLLGVGLSAWFWLPAMVEKQYIIFDTVFGKFYQSQFVSLQQLIKSPWGFGLSHPMQPEPGDMSYQLGLVQILVMLLLIPFVWVRRGIREIRVIGGIVLSLFVLSVFLMLNISLPVWERLPFLPLIQFPLRFSAIAVFAASIGAALLIKYLPFKKVLFIGFLILVIYANRNHWNINEKFDPGESYYLSLKTTTTSFNEHLPKWGKAMGKPASAKLEAVGKVGEVRVIRDWSAGILAEVEASKSAKLRLNQFYFPGWEIKVDSRPVSFNYLTDGESYGLPVFNIDSGKHQVLAEFKNTADRNLADGISIITVIMFIIVILNLCRLSRRIL